MRLGSVVLASSVLLAYLEISHSAGTGNVEFPVANERATDIYYIQGILNHTVVEYPAAAIDNHTLVAATADRLESPMICLEHNCTAPKRFVYRRGYAFWIRDTEPGGYANATIPAVFTGNISGANCTLNGGNITTTFKRIIKDKTAYSCAGKCKSHDVVICHNKVAGLLEKTNKSDSFILRNITDILRDYASIRHKNASHVKVFAVKFCKNGRNKRRRGFAAVALDGNTLVSYRWIDIGANTVSLCGRRSCFKPSQMLVRDPYIFWKTDREVSRNAIQFFEGDVTKSKCSLNGIADNVTFETVPAREGEFLCRPKCKHSDFVLCDGRIAGFLTETAIEDVFKLDTMPGILKLTTTDKPVQRQKHVRHRRKLNDGVTSGKTSIRVTEAGMNVSDQTTAAATVGTRNGTEVSGGSGGENTSKVNEQKTSENQTHTEKSASSKTTDRSGLEKVEKSKSDPNDRKTSTTMSNKSGEKSKQAIAKDSRDEIESKKTGEEADDISNAYSIGMEVGDAGSEEEDIADDDEDDEEELESFRVEDYDEDEEGNNSTKRARLRTEKPERNKVKPSERPILRPPSLKIAVRKAASLGNRKSLCILINVPVAIVLLLVNV